MSSHWPSTLRPQRSLLPLCYQNSSPTTIAGYLHLHSIALHRARYQQSISFLSRPPPLPRSVRGEQPKRCPNPEPPTIKTPAHPSCHPRPSPPSRPFRQSTTRPFEYRSPDPVAALSSSTDRVCHCPQPPAANVPTDRNKPAESNCDRLVGGGASVVRPASTFEQQDPCPCWQSYRLKD